MSIQAVADSLGISISTVSRALNGYTDVSAVTRQRVFDAAKAMNYSPHPMAHRLATGKTGSIAIVNAMRDGRSVDSSMAALHVAASETLREAGYFTLSLVLAGGDLELVELDRLIAGRLVDGIVLTRTRTLDARVQRLQEQKIPFVTYGRTLDNAPHAWVDTDYEQGIDNAMQALLTRGHRKIALLNGMAHMTFASLIERGMHRALLAGGLPSQDCPVHYTDLTGTAGLHAAQQLLRSTTPPTAFICASDALALGVSAAAREINLRVGEDVSVIGFGNTEAGQLAQPPLASISHDLMRHGQQAAELLLGLIAGQNPTGLHAIQSADLIERTSIGLAPGCA